MKLLWSDRRLFIAFFSICVLTFLASKSKEVSEFIWAIVAIVGTVAGSNAWQSVQKHKHSSNSLLELDKIPTDKSEAKHGKR